ncbi:MipA/OmpV family protein [Erwinia oleae]|uniref:MipA/OmpV family protein n=1 Tax=Erwinia oleae TaxID=796334 RepID=UPI000550AF3B|nr:MipA/OmpV family protein [Erwinia oleae]
MNAPGNLHFIHRSGLLIYMTMAAAFMNSARAEEYNASVGLGAAWVPYYSGADKYHISPVPQAQLFNGRLRLQGDELSVVLPLTDDVSIGPVVGYSSGRDSSDVSALNGLEDIDSTVLYGAFLRWQPGRFNATLKYLAAGDSDQGASATLSVGYDIYRDEQQKLTLGVSGMWNSSDYMQSWYGITPQQSASSERHYSVYTPSSGFSKITPGLSWQYQLSPHWRVNSALGWGILINDAKESPLAEKSSNAMGMVGLNYQF